MTPIRLRLFLSVMLSVQVLMVATPVMSAPEQAHWLKMPTGDDMGANWPADRSVEGRVLMHCKVGLNGRLNSCTILSEYPKGKGFGAATLGISRLFLMAPLKEEADITLPISWRLPGFPRTLPPVVASPPWTSVPSMSDVTSAYPITAAGKADQGRVSMSCYVMDDGSLKACYATSAVPAKVGFEEAALGLTSKYQVDPAWRSKIHDVLQVTFTIEIAKADGVAATPPTKP